MSDIKEFKRELRELLARYNATIQWGYADCSDLHGVYEQAIEVDLGGEPDILVFAQCLDSGDL